MVLNNVFIVLLLAFIYIILSEVFSLMSLAIGLALGLICTYVRKKFIPLGSVRAVNFPSLVFYFFYLIGQIYIAGFNAIKLIISSSSVEIVKVKTKINNDLLRVTLANSITLTPGTISLDLKDDTITVLWLRENKTPSPDMDPSYSNPADSNPGDLIKGNLEKILIKAER